MLSNGSVSGENNQEANFEEYSKKGEKREILDSDDQRTTAGETTIFVPVRKLAVRECYGLVLKRLW